MTHGNRSKHRVNVNGEIKRVCELHDVSGIIALTHAYQAG